MPGIKHCLIATEATTMLTDRSTVLAQFNPIMLSNVADMPAALAATAEDGKPVTPGLVACLRPYMREHIRRFGQYGTWTIYQAPSTPSRSRSRCLVTTFFHVS